MLVAAMTLLRQPWMHAKLGAIVLLLNSAITEKPRHGARKQNLNTPGDFRP
jgi:uncharacterized membrane protein